MDLSEVIGDFGKFQLWLNVLLFFYKYTMAFQLFSFSFLAPPMTYICSDGFKCCDDPVFNTSQFTRTMQTQWHLICDREWLISFSEDSFMCAVSIGSICFGIASDRYGRRKTITVAAVVEAVSGILASISPYDYWVFTFLRMITGFSIGGLMVGAFVLLIECVGCKTRDLCCAIHQLTFTMGHLTLALLGYFVRDFIKLQLIISMLNIILFVYICSLPESPRWLLAVGRTKQAVELLEIAAKMNQLPTHNITRFVEAAVRSNDYRMSTFTDWCKIKKLRYYLIIISFNWFTCNYYFFGVTLYVSRWTDNIITEVALVAVVGNIAVLLSIPLMKYMKRKTIIIISNVISGICAITYGLVPDLTSSAVFYFIGVIFNVVVFVLMFIHTSEVFPTVLRGTGLGIASMVSNLGYVVAPYPQLSKGLGRWCEPFVYGVMPIFVAVLYLMLPETKGLDLPDTIKEAINTQQAGVSDIPIDPLTSLPSAPSGPLEPQSSAKRLPQSDSPSSSSPDQTDPGKSDDAEKEK